MDSSIDSGTETETNEDIPVVLDTLTIEGVTPKMGDAVDLKVSGTISKIVNQTAWVTPTTVNDQPMPTDQTDAPSNDDLMSAAGQMDAANPMMGRGY